MIALSQQFLYIFFKVNFNQLEKTMKALVLEMKLKGYTMNDLADKLNISIQSVHNWLSGKFRPTPKNVKKLKELGFSDLACLEPNRDVEI